MSVPKKKNSNLDYVKLKSSLRRAELYNLTMKELQEKMDELTSEDYDDPEIIKRVCELVENITSVKLKGKEKLDCAIQLLTNKFPVLNNDKDITRITKQINNFVENGDIKKVSTLKKLGKSFLVWGVKKLIS